MDVCELEHAARSCYIEMLEAGYTAVGQLHHAIACSTKSCLLIPFRTLATQVNSTTCTIKLMARRMKTVLRLLGR